MSKRKADMLDLNEDLDQEPVTARPNLTLFSLPPTILGDIISRLDRQSIFQVSLTSRTAHQVVVSEETWHQRIKREFFQNNELSYPYPGFQYDEDEKHYQRYYAFLLMKKKSDRIIQLINTFGTNHNLTDGMVFLTTRSNWASQDIRLPLSSFEDSKTACKQILDTAIAYYANSEEKLKNIFTPANSSLLAFMLGHADQYTIRRIFSEGNQSYFFNAMKSDDKGLLAVVEKYCPRDLMLKHLALHNFNYLQYGAKEGEKALVNNVIRNLGDRLSDALSADNHRALEVALLNDHTEIVQKLVGVCPDNVIKSFLEKNDHQWLKFACNYPYTSYEDLFLSHYTRLNLVIPELPRREPRNLLNAPMIGRSRSLPFMFN